MLDVRGVGVIVFLFFTILIGWAGQGADRAFDDPIGRGMLVDRMPVVRSVYYGLKQIAETVFAQSDTQFRTGLSGRIPASRGIWAIGFVSTKAKGEIAAKLPEGEEMLSVFVATTPT